MASAGEVPGLQGALRSAAPEVRRQAMLAVLQAHQKGAGAAQLSEARAAAEQAAIEEIGALRVDESGVKWQGGKSRLGRDRKKGWSATATAPSPSRLVSLGSAVIGRVGRLTTSAQLCPPRLHSSPRPEPLTN